jgi:hypothetical protein
MHRVTGIIPALLSFVLVFAVGICLASTIPGAKDSAAKTTSKANKKSSVATKTTAKSTSKSSVKKSAATKTSHVLAPAEDLSGTIAAVDPSDKELTLVGSNGVAYDFDLTRKTRIELSNTNIGLKRLQSENHKQATVHFVPTSRGNLAENIQISAS